jgi:hypothetical protein
VVLSHGTGVRIPVPLPQRLQHRRFSEQSAKRANEVARVTDVLLVYSDPNHAFFETVEDDDTRGAAEAPKRALVQLGLDLHA